MISPTPRRTQPPANVLRGIFLVVRGRPEGLAQFGTSPEAVLAALAPFAAFLLVAAFLGLVGIGVDALADVAVATIGLVAPLVLSFEVARRLGRAGLWPRFAAAFCWCQWAAPLVLVAMLLLMSLLMAGGLSGNFAAFAGIAAMVGYGLWLHWFLARHALELPPWRAAGLVAAVNLVTSALIILPQAADYLVNGSPPG